MTEALAIATVGLPLLGALAAALARSPRAAKRVQVTFALLTAAVAGTLAALALAGAAEAAAGSWLVVDAPAGLLLAVATVVGLLSALAHAEAPTADDGALLGTRGTAVALQVFWATLLAVPLAANLAVAWLLIEATTAASALLVASGGRRGALEAGWKYLVLTTLGLTVALLGVVVLFAALDGDGKLATLDWAAIRAGATGLEPPPAIVAAVLILAGLAAKVGWAPVHNWLPDAHSEAPPPVSALLSAALLPAVALVAWRLAAALSTSPAAGAIDALLIAFGLASLAVAVPFLWRPLPLKRLLAYSSLEHMGVVALGIAFATPLAIAGVVLHVAGHALGKALGFYAAIPLLSREPALARRPPVALPAASRAGAGAVAVSLATLAGLPPGPLFFSELLILAGGIAAGELAIVVVAATLLALGFLGLAHVAIEALAGERRGGATAGGRPPRTPRLAALTAATCIALLALSAAAVTLPDSELVARIVRGLA